jgi:spoIIIJ-associated protein
MTKVEAPTLEEAYKKASEALECSISELQCEVVQHPSKGILGFLKKNAIIVATCKVTAGKAKVSNRKEKTTVESPEESVASEIIATVKEEKSPKEKQVTTKIKPEAIVDNFFDTHTDEESVVYDELALRIENELKELLSHSCFEIDVIEVDVRDNTALIFIDGNDAALLIGKEGYRYNALSYMLFNWLHTKYELFIKLEIAEFLTTQQEMIRAYIKPVIETAEKEGRAKTRFLDGILVQIALEQLRERFPDKYVAVKTSRDGKKFVVINEFNNKSNG